MATVDPLQGSQARVLAASQGIVWCGIVEARTIAEHVEIGEVLDRQGDGEMHAHLTAQLRLAQDAKEAGHHELYRGLVKEIARTRRLIELDDAEDYHRRATGTSAHAAGQDLQQSNVLHGVLLGQREAIEAVALTGAMS